jgi:hypothetical protein
MRARPILLPLLLLVVLGAGYTAWWFYAVGVVRDGIANWIATERAQASFIEYKGLEVSGFPLSLTAKATDFSVRRADGLSWRGPEATAHARPWNPLKITVDLPGEQEAAIVGQGAAPPLSIVAKDGGTGLVTLRLSGAVEDATLHLSHVTAGLPGGLNAATLGQLELRATFPETPPANHTGTAVTIQADLKDLGLPPDRKSPLGRTIDTAAFTARIKGQPPARFTQPAIAAWSRSGGIVEIDALNLAWGPLGMTGAGTLALDGELQPMGAVSTEVTGINPTMDSLASAGIVRPGDAAMAKVALGLLSRRSTPDKQPIVEASVTAQDGWLYFGPVRLMRMPRLNWD